MRENLRDLITGAIKWLTIGSIFLTPLLFSPFNFDFFEFPKQVFIWSVAALLLVLWLAKCVIDNELAIIKTPFDVPLLLFIGITTVSALLARDTYTAVAGFFGRPDGGLAALLAYAVIFYVASSHFTRVKDSLQALTALIASCLILAILGLLSYFGVPYVPIKTDDPRIFSPAGSLFVLVGLLPMVIPVGLGLLMYLRKQTGTSTPAMTAGFSQEPPIKTTSLAPVFSIGVTVSMMVALAVIVAVGTSYAIIGTIVGVVVLLLWSKRGDMKAIMPYLVGLVVICLFWLALTKVSVIRSQVPFLNQTLKSPPVLDAKQSWVVASNTIREYPFFGTGPATFLFDFTRFRSLQLNTTDTWNLRFVVPHNQYLLVLATTGILGLLAYLFLVFRISLYGFKTALSNRDAQVYPVKVGIFGGIMSFIVLTAFTPATSTTFFSFTALLALFIAFEHATQARDVGMRRVAFALPSQSAAPGSRPSSIVPMAFLIAGLGIAGASLFVTAHYVSANVAYVKGSSLFGTGKANKIDSALRLQEKATQINKYEDGYHRDLAKSAITVALAISQKKDITDDDRKVVTNLVQLAEMHAREAARLEPLNVTNWQTLAEIYRQVAPQIKGAGDLALQAFNQAVQTDPANAQLFLDIGGIFYAANSYDTAIDAFKHATDLKPDLPNAQYNLANAYLKKGEYDLANAAYQRAKLIVSNLPNSDTSKKDSLAKLDTEIAAIADKVSSPSGTVAGESTQNTPLPTPATVVSPSPSPTPTATVKASPASKTGSPSPSPSAHE